MAVKSKIKTGDSGWAFAEINGRRGEIFFDVGKGIKGIKGHCYHSKKDVWTKRELKMMHDDIVNKNHRFSYRKGAYRRIE